MNRLFELIFKNRLLVICAACAIAALGIVSWNQLPIDAFPDVTNVQVMVLTQAPGLAPEEVERLISTPLERVMNGLPAVTMVRSLSRAGLSQVVVVFHDKTDLYFARQQVFERLQSAKEDLPEGYQPEMGPISTGLGEIYQFTLSSDSMSLTDLRSLQDWVIKPQLRSVPGVTEVNSFGGFAKQYQVIVDPILLARHRIALKDVEEAIARNSGTAPGNYITRGQEQLVVRSDGRMRTMRDIEQAIITTVGGVPVKVGDVAQLQIGHETRWGAATRDGKGETVCGMVIMLKDANSSTVVKDVKTAIAKIQGRLPAGVTIKPFYDRMSLITDCINTVLRALIESGFLVILILVPLLGDVRTALVVCVSLPLSAFITFIFMRLTGLSANLMSLGGLVIALGMVVDASVVVAENIYRHLSLKPYQRVADKIAACVAATTEVWRPVFFAILITILTKIPLFALQAVEGKMFKPLALTLIYSMLGSLVISLTVIPVLGSLFIRGKQGSHDSLLIRWTKRAYLPLLARALNRRWWTIGIAAAWFAMSLGLVRLIGTEFLPYLDEGSIAINVVKLPTVSLEESVRVGSLIEQQLMGLPEVETIVTKTGRAEIAEDPMGPEQNDVFIMLKPRKHWKVGSKQELIELIEQRLAVIPGIKLNFSQPIALRVNELISGIKSDVAVKVFGQNLDRLVEVGEVIEREVGEIEGAEDVKVEQVAGSMQLDIVIDRSAIARHGITVENINGIVEAAVGGKAVSEFNEGDRKFSVAVRYPERYRGDVKAISNILVPSPMGHQVPLGQLAALRMVETPNQISRENGMRRVVVECNVRGRDIGSFIAEVQRRIGPVEKSLPTGYFIEYGGQFENQQRAMRTLAVVVPVVIILIFLLLYMALGSARPALLVILNLPFAWVGGVLVVVLFNITLSVSAVVGFITLFGIAVANGTVLVAFMQQLREKGLEMREVVVQACEIRLRPLLLTSLAAMLGLIPVLLAQGPGAEIQKPLAAVVLGGLFTSFIMTMIVLPVLYETLGKRDS